MRHLTLLFLFLPCTCALAQTISGRVTDATTGEPLPYASIYVPATKGGTATNAEGYFRLALGGGRRFVVSYLGYQTMTKTVSGGEADVALEPESLDLEQVEILSSGEDRGYPVIRRAIAKADYHRNQLDAYTAEVYLKGTGKITKIPGLLKRLAPKEDRQEIDESLNKAFTSETTSRIEYRRPNVYKEQVLSKLEVGEADFDAGQYIFTSFYDPLVAKTVVSPLHPRAFGYYRFEHQGATVDNDELIHKIAVIPRSKGEDVFTGFVYVVQDDWSLHSLDLTTYKLGFEINIKQSFSEVEERVWMPISTTLGASGQLFGVGFEYDYLSTVSNYDLELNPDLGGYVEVIDEKSQPAVAERTKKARKLSELEQRLNDGEDIRARDLRKLMRNYERGQRQEQPEPEVVSQYTYVRDSTVEIITDTARWAIIRPVPLTREEQAAYVRADSIATAKAAADEAEADGGTVQAGTEDGSVTVTTDGSLAKFLFGGGKFRKGLVPEPFFTPVEGYALGARLSLTHRKRKYGIGLTPRYGFAWRRLSWEADLFGGLSGEGDEKKWRLSGGRFLRQFNDRPAIDPWISTFANLLNGVNFIRLYERAYGQFDYRKQYGEKFRVAFTAAYEDRRAVTNNSQQAWFGSNAEDTYAPNAPLNTRRGRVLTVAPAATYRFLARWRPGLKYTVRDGERTVVEESAPIVTAELRGGVPGIGNSVSDFFVAELGHQRRFQMGRKGLVNVLGKVGAFLRNDRVDFPDFKHFTTTEFWFTSLDPIKSYRLLPYYQESTAREYAQVFAHYQFRKFLLTRITAVQLRGIREDLFVNYLYTPESRNYTELGYSLDNIMRVFRLEFVTAFRDFRYDDFGVRLSLSSAFISL